MATIQMRMPAVTEVLYDNPLKLFVKTDTGRAGWSPPVPLPIGFGTVSGTVIPPPSRGLKLSLYPSPIKLPSGNPQQRFRDRFRRKGALSRRVQRRMPARLPVNGTGESLFSTPESEKRPCKASFRIAKGAAWTLISSRSFWSCGHDREDASRDSRFQENEG